MTVVSTHEGIRWSQAQNSPPPPRSFGARLGFVGGEPEEIKGWLLLRQSTLLMLGAGTAHTEKFWPLGEIKPSTDTG